MLGALIGDIAGSRYLHQQRKLAKNAELLSAISGCKTTTISGIVLAAAESILKSGNNHSAFKEQLIQNLSKFEQPRNDMSEIHEDMQSDNVKCIQ